MTEAKVEKKINVKNYFVTMTHKKEYCNLEGRKKDMGLLHVHQRIG